MMKDNEIKELISKGYIHCKVIFEMAGNPKEHVEKTLKQYINAIKEDPDYIFLTEQYAPCEETEGVWSTFHESDMLVRGFEKLNMLSFNMSPASIEIIRPEAFSFTQKTISDWYGDLLSKIHEIGLGMKELGNENEALKINLNRLIRNCVILSLTEPKDVSAITSKVGVDAEHLQPFLDAMIKEKSLILENGKYQVNK